MPECDSRPELTIVVAARDQADSIERLLDEIEAAMADRRRFEVIYVDDASTDATAAELERLAASRQWLRPVRHEFQGGKSAALWTGVLAADAPVVATLDADGRNDPMAIPRMVDELATAGPGCGLVAAQRVGRHDPALTRFRSKIANAVRDALLDDGTRDAACGLKCFPRAVFLELPYFDGLHRFLPTLIRRDGYAVSLVDVIDRPSWRPTRRPGLFSGLWRGTWDLIGVSWLVHRRAPLPPVVPDGRPSMSRIAPEGEWVPEHG